MSVASLVEKATSDLLINPDWGRNLELCDILNSDPGQAKEVVKAAKKRLAVKNTTVQLLTLTVLETLIKNCGDAVHQQVAERDVLHEMVKIVKKKADLAVRDKILTLLDSWQEAFGGQRGRYPQYFAAYDELRRSGVEFPEREDAVPIFTPPQTHPITAYPPPPPPFADPGFAGPGFAGPGFGGPGFAPDQQIPMEANLQPLSLADLDNARGGMEVLSEMLNAIDPRDKAALNEELIVELVGQCRTTQKQVMNLVNTTSDEALLFQALALNDDLQKVLAKRDAIASGAPVPPDTAVASPNFVHEEEESEDDFAQLAHRPRNASELPKPAPPAPLRIPGPPAQVTKIPPPGGPRKQSSQSVDLLSRDVFGGTQSAQAAISVSNHRPVQNPSDEDEDNLNPFALRHNQQDNSSSRSSSQAASQSSQSLNAQQQAYGSSTDKQGAPVLPPPPQKNSQRQQYFQQHQTDQNELVTRTQKLSVATEDDDMINPYAAYYQPQQQQPQQDVKQKQAGFHPVGKKPDSLFSDLVDLQSAKMKPGSGGL